MAHGLLYREFAVLLGVAFLVAVPLAWIAMYKWLNNYAFRIDMHWRFFLLPFVAIAVVALAIVSFQSIRAATTNPVRSLKTE